jgi:CxxC-x17-CxxC domain-containing protein
MHQGNWKCSTCGGAITELPFVPRSESGLTCRTCYAKGKSKDSSSSVPPPEMPVASEAPDIPDYAEVAGEPSPYEDFSADMVPVTPSEKPKFAGSWKCASCGGAITSLPFTPRDVTNLKCLDCFKRSKA